jgi:putative phage-type endonuclease
MSAVEVGRYEPGSPEWHAARLRGVGASEIAAVVGLSPWESAWSLWHRKAGLVGPAAETDLMLAGNDFEPAIADRYALRHPEETVTRTGSWRSTARPWQLANPDRLIDGHTPLEVKFSPFGDGWGEDGTDEIPIYYRCQVLWQMDVLDVDHGVLFAWVSGTYREYRLKRDGDAVDDIALLRAAAETFWASLPTAENPDGTPPALDDSDHTLRVVREMAPGVEDREQIVPAALAADWRAARVDLDQAERRKRLLDTRLLFAMGTARRAVLADTTRVAIRVAMPFGIQLRETKPPKTTKTVKDAIDT